MCPMLTRSSIMSLILSLAMLPITPIPGLSSPLVTVLAMVSTSSDESLMRPGITVTATPTAGMTASW